MLDLHAILIDLFIVISRFLLHLLEVGVLDVVGLLGGVLLRPGLLAASELVTTRLPGCAALLVHLL